MRVAILGSLEVESGGRRVEPSGARLQSLLAPSGQRRRGARAMTGSAPATVAVA